MAGQIVVSDQSCLVPGPVNGCGQSRFDVLLSVPNDPMPTAIPFRNTCDVIPLDGIGFLNVTRLMYALNSVTNPSVSVGGGGARIPLPTTTTVGGVGFAILDFVATFVRGYFYGFTLDFAVPAITGVSTPVTVTTTYTLANSTYTSQKLVKPAALNFSVFFPFVHTLFNSTGASSTCIASDISLPVGSAVPLAAGASFVDTLTVRVDAAPGTVFTATPAYAADNESLRFKDKILAMVEEYKVAKMMPYILRQLTRATLASSSNQLPVGVREALSGFVNNGNDLRQLNGLGSVPTNNWAGNGNMQPTLSQNLTAQYDRAGRVISGGASALKALYDANMAARQQGQQTVLV